MIRTLLADNQAIFRAGTARVLDAQEDISILAQCENEQQLLETLERVHSGVAIVAHAILGDVDRLFAAASAASMRVVLMAENTDDASPTLLRRIDGLLTRRASTGDLLACVRRVGSGERNVPAPEASPADPVGHRIREMLTPRELQIVGFVVQGLKNRQIAEELGTKEQVVKNYLRSIYDKTGASDRLELALFTLHHRVLADAAAKATEALQLRPA